ncbi:RHS repeat-associated core domain-containing protein [Phytoactinopolyspora endophytica]|uniref:RHS repeat-associated core domain-containing protein n=1 Tax=Phytoactinopolyspora endophytica TaxID=1642495 RepID=UPI0013EA58C1|nr:RHS repeat-associated core domain-containing protein [Phytoactinopolyspora endophytica]
MNTATGALTESSVDAQSVAPGVPAALSRSYNSNDGAAGLTGQGWSSPYSAHLEIGDSSVTYVAEDGQEVVYEAAGDSYVTPPGVTSKLRAVADGFELVTEAHEVLAFDDQGRLQSSVDSSGEGVSLSYSDGVLDSVSDASGRDFDLSYNADGVVSSIALADGESVSYGYDGDLLTSVTDARGGVTEYGYDSAGRLTSITDALGSTVMQTTYDAEGRVVERVDASGGTTTFEYVDDGDTTTTYTTDPRGGVTRDVYMGNVLLETETPENEVTTYAYDQRLRLVAETDPHGRVTRYAYDDDDNLIRTGYANGEAEEFTYSADGDLLTETSPEGMVTEYTYDSAHRVLTETDPEGGVTSYTYTSSGLVETETTPEGRTTSFEYDAEGNRTAEVSPEGRRTTFTYDALGRVVSETSPRGNESGADPADYTTTFSYDATGNLVSTTDPLGNVTEYEYDAVGRRSAVEDALGRRTVNEYDPAGNLVTLTEPGGAVTTHEYDLAGNRVSSTGPEGGVTSWMYDADGRMVSRTSPRGNEDGADAAAFTWTYAYDGMGNLVSETDPQGRVTTYGYDERYRQTSVTDPAGRTTTSEYDGDGNLVGSSDALGNTTTTVYNGLGLPVEVSDPAGNTATTVYDGDGLTVSESTPMGHSTTYAYDDDGQQVSRTTPRGNADGATPADHTWTQEYDADGYLVSTTDPLGADTTATYDPRGLLLTATDQTDATTTHSYDALGRVTSVVGPDGAETTYSYTPAGEVETVTDANGGTVTYAYDDAHRQTSVVDPLGRTRTFGYDAEGNRTTEVTARGRESGDEARWTISTDYDERGLATEVTTGSAESSRSFTYDDAGQLTSFTDASGTTDLTYDDNGQLLTVARDGEQYTYTYGSRGEITSTTYPDGSTFDYEYNADAERVRSILPDDRRDEYDYDPDGNLTATRHAPAPGTISNRIWAERQAYDAAGRVASTSFGTSEGFPTRTIYERDPAGRPVTKTTGTSEGESYTYDDAGRLARACFFDDTAPEPCTDQASAHVGYAYDGVGNRLTEDRVGLDDPGSVTYNYDAANQLTSRGSTNYTYDADGNLTGDGTTTRVYDVFNQLIETDDGTKRAEITYDAQGNRAAVKTYRSGLGTTRTLSWDINAALPLLTTVDDVTGDSFYRYDPHGNPSAGVLDGEEAAIFTDALGSVIDVRTRTPGTTLWHGEYEPFGTLRDSSGTLSTSDVGLGFTGAYLDPSTDLLHLRARDYNPSPGRFITTDPATPDPGTQAVSPYAYVNNQPTTFTDPSGACFPFWEDWCSDAIADLVGTSQDEGAPSRGEFFGGIGLGLAQGAEESAYFLISGGGNPGFGEHTGWDGNYIAGQTPNTGWYPYSSALGELLFYGGTAAIPYGALNTALRAGIPHCPPGLVTTSPRFVPRSPSTADDWPVLSGITRDATKGKGNFGLGSGTASQAERVGQAWVGEGYTVASDGKTLVSADKLRQWRPPSYKPRLGKWQSNFESRMTPHGRWQTNGHLDITDLP